MFFLEEMSVKKTVLSTMLLGLLLQPATVSAQDAVSTQDLSTRSMLEAFARGEDVSEQLSAIRARKSARSERPGPRRESTALDQLESAMDALAEGDGTVRSVEDVLAADLLVRARFASVERRLEAEGLPGVERLDQVRDAYGERMDPVVEHLRAWAGGSQGRRDRRGRRPRQGCGPRGPGPGVGARCRRFGRLRGS